MYNCPDCNDTFEKGSTFCQQCGCNLEKKFLYDPICPECTKAFDDGTQFCDEDGAKLTTADKLIPKCIECGKSFIDDTKFCPDDGQRVLTDYEKAQGNPTTLAASNTNSAAIDGNYQVKIGHYFSAGLELFKQNIGGFIGFTILIIVINMVLSFIPIIGSFLSTGINAPLIAGYYLVARKLINNESTEFGDFFKGFDYFLPLFLAGIVSGFFITIGLLLLILPGIYLAVAYTFTSLIIIDRKLSFFDAMETSRKLITKKWFAFFGFSFLIGLINLLGIMLFGLGIVLTLPVTMCAIAVAYDDIVNNQLA